MQRSTLELHSTPKVAQVDTTLLMSTYPEATSWSMVRYQNGTPKPQWMAMTNSRPLQELAASVTSSLVNFSLYLIRVSHFWFVHQEHTAEPAIAPCSVPGKPRDAAVWEMILNSPLLVHS